MAGRASSRVQDVANEDDGLKMLSVSFCDICVKGKISSINETK
jgi:hypothetical protein